MGTRHTRDPQSSTPPQFSYCLLSSRNYHIEVWNSFFFRCWTFDSSFRLAGSRRRRSSARLYRCKTEPSLSRSLSRSLSPHPSPDLRHDPCLQIGGMRRSTCWMTRIGTRIEEPKTSSFSLVHLQLNKLHTEKLIFRVRA
jgi:hypothetical protein